MKKLLLIPLIAAMLATSTLSSCTASSGSPASPETDTESSVISDTEADTSTETESEPTSETGSESTVESDTEGETESETVPPNLGKLEDPTRLSGFLARKHITSFLSDGGNTEITPQGVVHLNAIWDAAAPDGRLIDARATVIIKYVTMLKSAGHKVNQIPNGPDYEGEPCTVIAFKVKAKAVTPNGFYMYYNIGSGASPQMDTSSLIFPTVTPTGTEEFEYLVFDMSKRAHFTEDYINYLTLTWFDDFSNEENANAYMDIYEIALFPHMADAYAYMGVDAPADVPVTPPTENIPLPETAHPVFTEGNSGAAVTEDPTAVWGDPTYIYNCADATFDDTVQPSHLRTYKEKTDDDLDTLYRYYLGQGYLVYTDNNKGGNRFITLVKGDAMAHMYLYDYNGELTIITSDTAAAHLPPQNPAVTTGSYKTSVTQMTTPEYTNTMGYVTQLADGSFIVHDGGAPGQMERIYRFMRENLPEGAPIIIRAWVLTHSHGDHYPAFCTFAERYGGEVILENFIFAPVGPDILIDNRYEENSFFIKGDLPDKWASFKNEVNVIYAHTGMEFTFCNLKMEVLHTADELYKIYGSSGYQEMTDVREWNHSSIVTRLYDDTYSFLCLGDTMKTNATFMTNVFGEYLQSDMVQAAHHSGPNQKISFYKLINPTTVFVPCNSNMWYNQNSNRTLRENFLAADFIHEILVAGVTRYTRYWGEVPEKGAHNLPVAIPNPTGGEID